MDALIARLDVSPALGRALVEAKPHFRRYLNGRVRRELDRTEQSTLDFIRPLFDEAAAEAAAADDDDLDAPGTK